MGQAETLPPAMPATLGSSPAPLLRNSPVQQAWALRLTVRRKIILAFVVAGLLTVGLGAYAVHSVREAGGLVAETFDRALMSINYARAASADFAGLEALLARRRLAAAADAAELDARADRLLATLGEDLAVAAERAMSPEAARAARDADEAVHGWQAIRAQVVAGGSSGRPPPAAWGDLDRQAALVAERLDLLVEQSAGDAFLLRQRAAAAARTNVWLNLAGLGGVLLMGAAVALLLARRIMGPVAAASAAASRIAHGELDIAIPQAGADELGALLRAMEGMRDEIRARMDREVALRRRAQVRMVDAIESSGEAVVVVDPAGRIAAANAQSRRFFPEAAGALAEGEAFGQVVATPSGAAAFAEPERRAEPDRTALAGLLPGNPVAGAAASRADAARDVRLPSGRWLRVGRSATRDGGFVAICSDITSLKRQQAELERTNLCFDAALSNMSQGLCLYDSGNRLRVANTRFQTMFDLPSELLEPGIQFENLLRFSSALGTHDSREIERIVEERLALVARREACTHFEELSDGRVIAIAHEPLADGGWVATFEDITERRRAEAQVTFMARHDPLTGLPNRILFRERVEQAVAGLGRGQDFAVLCLDLDHFKAVNDTLGHPAGDALLRQVADRLQACARETDTVARLGGDEFAIVQSGIDRPDSAAELAHRIIQVVGAPYDLDGQQAVIGVSVGIAAAPGDGSAVDALLRNADLALYRAKEEGRGTVRFFEPEMDARQQARRALERDLRAALATDALELYYQPLINVREDRVCGFEALMRWRHPVRGMVPPSEFIQVAEDAGLIVAMGEWAIGRACREAATWPDGIKVAVNVSPLQFRSHRLIDVVEASLARTGLPPDRLELEITETTLLQDNEVTMAMLHELKRLGVRISMDDFGTGYSSLGYLRSFPFDKIKIDQSFVRNLATDADDPGADPDGSGAIVRAIAGLGSTLGMRTTAEGVETQAQFACLRREGCTEVQGYLFSRPTPADELPALIERLSGRVPQAEAA